MTLEQSSEIHKLLKIGEFAEDQGVHGNHEAKAPAPATLPVAETVVENQTVAHDELRVSEDKSINAYKSARTFKLKHILIYPLVFLLAFGFFYVLLNFSALWSQFQGFFVKPQEQVVLGNQMEAYYKWIGGYYFSVGDRNLLEPNGDIDRDGLSNMDEFIMRTNPVLADSDGDGYNDGLEVLHGFNPWGSGRMTEAQTKLASTLDTAVINNRISYNSAPQPAPTLGVVSGANTISYNQETPGKLSIPRLNMQVPIIWSQDPANFDADLSKGVIHYPGTSMPGNLGTVYISGHSSDYIWKRSQFGQVFARINHLQPGDDIFVELYGLDGKTYNYRYQVTGQKTHTPDDQTQFIDNSGYKLNLSTCWPIGTTKERLVVSAVQVPL
jgi:LPXTG-site transpeptidase (sortase) family protein